jgi:hypothetical protein
VVHFYVITLIPNTCADKPVDTLRSKLPFHWQEEKLYDIVNPFGDRRGHEFDALWTVDIANNVLFLTDRDQRRSIFLSILRQHKVTLVDMKYTGPAVPLPLQMTMEPGSTYWESKVEADERLHTPTRHILRQFDDRWRYLFRTIFSFIPSYLRSVALLPLRPPLDSKPDHLKPEVRVDERLHAFTHRIFRDFNHQ